MSVPQGDFEWLAGYRWINGQKNVARMLSVAVVCGWRLAGSLRVSRPSVGLSR